jgi:anaerobic magnesium-protoporphyrin IX monomethyl ester cyclase
MIKKVLIVIPNARWSGIRQYNTHPYAACLVAATIKDKYEVEILDTNLKNHSLDYTIDKIKETAPDLIGLSSMSIEYSQSSHKLTALIKKELPEITIVMGGAYPTLLPEVVFKDKNIDYLVLAEGEIRFPKLLDSLNNGLDTDKLDGIASRKNDKPIINAPIGYENDLDKIPYPAYELVNYEDYSTKNNQYSLYNNPRYLPYGVTITSRGCPFKCVFCSSKDIMGRTVRNRSAENVLKEIDWLVKEYGIREVIFLDDNLFLNKERIKAILNGLIERNYDLHWKAINVPAFSLNDELMGLMKKSGCYQVSLPIESGNEHVLKNIIRKPLNLKKACEVIDLAKKYEFETIACFVIGLPGETWDQILDSVNFADKINVDWVVFNIATPLPNTELYDIAKKGGYLEPGFNYTDFEFFGYGHGSITTDDFTPIELQMLRAFEWDRINFKTKEKQEKIALMNSITMKQLHEWRVSTRRSIGVNVDYNTDSSDKEND